MRKDYKKMNTQINIEKLDNNDGYKVNFYWLNIRGYANSSRNKLCKNMNEVTEFIKQVQAEFENYENEDY